MFLVACELLVLGRLVCFSRLRTHRASSNSSKPSANIGSALYVCKYDPTLRAESYSRSIRENRCHCVNYQYGIPPRQTASHSQQRYPYGSPTSIR